MSVIGTILYSLKMMLKMREYEEWGLQRLNCGRQLIGGGANAAMEGQLVIKPHADETRAMSGQEAPEMNGG